jgi:hypothetical protein
VRFDKFDAVLLGVVIGAVMNGVITTIIEGENTVGNLCKQAIERGYAEYVVDSDGKTTWQWKEAK